MIIITKHKALVEFLREKGIALDAKVIEHATLDDIRGEHVVGVLPIHMAAEADRMTVIPLNLPPEARGRELTLDEVRRYAGPPATYKVVKVEGGEDLI